MSIDAWVKRFKIIGSFFIDGISIVGGAVGLLTRLCVKGSGAFLHFLQTGKSAFKGDLLAPDTLDLGVDLSLSEGAGVSEILSGVLLSLLGVGDLSPYDLLLLVDPFLGFTDLFLENLLGHLLDFVPDLLSDVLELIGGLSSV